MNWRALNARLSPYFGNNFMDLPLWKRINWLHFVALLGIPVIAIYGVLTSPFVPKTLIWSFVYYQLTALGITAGYHRLFSHRSYSASLPIRFILILLGTGAVEGSVRWWCRDHRAHHRYVDTCKDPYDVNQGFFYAHIGWMLIKQDPSRIGRADISDLNADALIRWQHRNYLPLAFFMAFLFPAGVAGFGWGDWRGGLLLAGALRLTLVHHSTFFVNSLAHYWGNQAYTDGHSAKNSLLTALLTMGEGYHNFHHEFPRDYRNAIRWYQYDPTKWFIRCLAALRLAGSLQRFPERVIQMGRLQMAEKRLQQEMAKVDWGPADSELPLWSQAELQRELRAGRALLVLRGRVLDVGGWMAQHPGGTQLLRGLVGRDVTAAFQGEVYRHSHAAYNVARGLAVARVSVATHHAEPATSSHAPTSKTCA